MKPKVGLEYSDKTSYFELKLFSSASRNFSVIFTRYLGGPPDLLFCVSKKNHDRNVTTHQSDYMSEKAKKVEILKNEA